MAKLKYHNGQEWEQLAPTMEEFDGLAGAGRTNETVKGNADAIDALSAEFAPTVIYPTAGGTANAITIAQSGFTKTDGRKAYFKAKYTNTGNVTANVNSTGVSSVRNIDGNHLAAGDIEQGNYYEIVWNATQNFFVLRPRGAKLDGIISAIEAWGGTVAAPQKADDVVTAIQNVASWDEDFTAENLREGITALGITGTLVPSSFAYGTGSILQSNDTARYLPTNEGWIPYTKMKEITSSAAFGTFTASWEQTSGGDASARRIYSQIRINGVAVGTEQLSITAASTYETKTQNIDVSAGDTIELWSRCNNYGGVRNFRIKCNTLFTNTLT